MSPLPFEDERSHWYLERHTVLESFSDVRPTPRFRYARCNDDEDDNCHTRSSQQSSTSTSPLASNNTNGAGVDASGPPFATVSAAPQSHYAVIALATVLGLVLLAVATFFILRYCGWQRLRGRAQGPVSLKLPLDPGYARVASPEHALTHSNRNQRRSRGTQERNSGAVQAAPHTDTPPAVPAREVQLPTNRNIEGGGDPPPPAYEQRVWIVHK